MTKFTTAMIREAAGRLAGRVVRTPLLSSPMLDEAVGAQVLVKAECLQTTGSFKIRGALNRILAIPPGERAAGVVTYSVGNHGQGVAAAANLLDCSAVVVLPTNAARIKVDNCRWWGAEVIFYDPATQDRRDVAEKIVHDRGMVLVPPFDDLDVMAGQGTVGLEIAAQLRERDLVPDDVLVACSGGGLSAGVITALRGEFPDIRPYLVEPAGRDKMARSLASGRRQELVAAPATVMDALAGPVPGTLPLAVLEKYQPFGLTVGDQDALEAVALAFRYLKIVLEPGGAAPLAAALTHKERFENHVVVLVASGGNIDDAVFVNAIQGAR